MDGVIDVGMQNYIYELYKDNAYKLQRMVDKMIAKYGGISGKDRDDFYSIAGDTISDILDSIKNPRADRPTYDKTKGNFEGYIYRAIKLAIIDNIKYRNAEKRSSRIVDDNGDVHYLQTVSIETPIGEDESFTIGDFLCNQSDGLDFFESSELNNQFLDEHIEKFLSSLSDLQNKILRMKMEYMTGQEIQDALGITRKQYELQLKEIKSYERLKILRRNGSGFSTKKGDDIMSSLPNTSEKTKYTNISVSSMRKKLKNREWRDDHLLQRYSGMWNSFEKSELMVDMMWGKALTQIIVSEEIRDGLIYRWLIDGKQRCTNIDSFCAGDFTISKKVQRPFIVYQTTKKTEDGEICCDEYGNPIYEEKTFDVRGKKFFQLPQELQESILDYPIPVLINLNCDRIEIAHDIARFNRGRTMNKSQNGWTEMDENCAFYIDRIIDEMQFFKTDFVGSNYTNNNKLKGEMRRIVTDSIMLTYFPDKYNKEFGVTCKNFVEEVKENTYANFISLVERISKVANEETEKVFNSTHSKIWFALFNKCSKYGITDGQFVEFVKAFNEELSETEIDGFTYNAIGNKSTKDNSVLQRKVKHLETLMKMYFDDYSNDEDTFVLDSNWCDYVEKFSKTRLMNSVDMDETSLIKVAIQTMMLINKKEDISHDAMQEYIEDEFIEEETMEYITVLCDMLVDYTDRVIENPEVLSESNIPVLVSSVAYLMDNEDDISEKEYLEYLPTWISKWKYGADSETMIHNYNMVMDDLENNI